jgi:hypothetical protein
MGRRKLETKENPEQRFKRVAEYRTRVVLDKLRLLGNCSNRHIYRYSEKDVEKIFSAISTRLKETRTKFETDSKSDNFFKL